MQGNTSPDYVVGSIVLRSRSSDSFMEVAAEIYRNKNSQLNYRGVSCKNDARKIVDEGGPFNKQDYKFFIQSLMGRGLDIYAVNVNLTDLLELDEIIDLAMGGGLVSIGNTPSNRSTGADKEFSVSGLTVAAGSDAKKTVMAKDVRPKNIEVSFRVQHFTPFW